MAGLITIIMWTNLYWQNLSTLWITYSNILVWSLFPTESQGHFDLGGLS